MTSWTAPRANTPVTGTLVVPGSKSASARALVLAALADRPATISGLLDSRDTTLMRAGLEQLGATITDDGPATVRVEPIISARGGGRIDVGLAGTVLRFLPPIAALAETETSFVGDQAAANRPVAPLLKALAQLGAQVSSPHRLPFRVAGAGDFAGGPATIDASGSSQFISALLLAAPRYRDGLVLRHTGERVPSRPHIDMTCTMLRRRGVGIECPDEVTWQVCAGPIEGRDDVVEPDLTNAATLLAAAVITGGELTTAWPTASVQASDELAAVLAAFGANLVYTQTPSGRTLTVSGSGVHGAAVDLHAVSELAPVAAALATVADGPTTISGVAHIRGHETDRLAALEAELTAVGASVTQTADGLIIRPGTRRGGLFHTYADHRMAHAGALIGLVTDGIELDDVSCTTKTLPDFPGMWAHLVGGTR